MTTTTWESFLRVSSASTTDVAPVADEAWLASRGVQAEAPRVLHHLFEDVLPLVRDLGTKCSWFSFLVHDRGGGVPTSEDDRSVYIHLRLTVTLTEGDDLVLPSPWLWTRRAELSREIAGVDCTAFKGGADAAWEIIGWQSEWLLDFIEVHVGDDMSLIKHMRQFLHFFANMAQMRVA